MKLTTKTQINFMFSQYFQYTLMFKERMVYGLSILIEFFNVIT